MFAGCVDLTEATIKNVSGVPFNRVFWHGKLMKPHRVRGNSLDSRLSKVHIVAVIACGLIIIVAMPEDKITGCWVYGTAMPTVISAGLVGLDGAVQVVRLVVSGFADSERSH